LGNLEGLGRNAIRTQKDGYTDKRDTKNIKTQIETNGQQPQLKKTGKENSVVKL